MAVYTDVSADELDAFLDDYDVGKAISFKGIAEGVENSNYLLTTEKSHYILTLYEKRVDPADLPFFIGLMDHVAREGVPGAVPVRDRAGETLKVLNGRPACLITFLNGMSVTRIETHHCARIGTALAEFHEAAAGFTLSRRNALDPEGCRPLFDSVAARTDEVEPGLGELIAHELDLVDKGWPHDLPTGVIHADLFPDNVFFLDGEISGLIDFYFACNDLLAYDLAVCLNAWCFERDGSINVTKASRLLTAYNRVRPLSPRERETFPLLAQGAALRFLATRLYDWLNPVEGARVRPKNPLEYVQKLRFHAQVKSIEDYGLIVE